VATTFTYSDEELSTTAAAYLTDERRGMQDRPHPFALDVLANKQDESGGERVIIPWDVQRHSQTTEFVSGYESANLSISPISKPGSDGWWMAVRPIVISERDELINRGKHKVLDRLKRLVTDTDRGALDEFDRHLLQGGLAGYSDLNHLNGFDYTDGFLEENAPGLQTNVVHGVSKGTYSALPGFQNQIADINGAFSTNGLPALHKICTQLREITDDPGKCMGYMSIDGATNLKRATQEFERYGEQGDPGRPILMFSGIKFKVTSFLPNSGATTSTEKWSFLMLDHSSIKFRGQQGVVMSMTPFRDVGGGHIAKVAFLRTMGQLTVSYFGSTGVAFNGDAW